MKLENIISSIIIAISLISFALIEKSAKNYTYEKVKWGDDDHWGWTVRVESKSGDRCLMEEGPVASISDWQRAAKEYPVPLEICQKLK